MDPGVSWDPSDHGRASRGRGLLGCIAEAGSAEAIEKIPARFREGGGPAFAVFFEAPPGNKHDLAWFGRRYVDSDRVVARMAPPNDLGIRRSRSKLFRSAAGSALDVPYELIGRFSCLEM